MNLKAVLILTNKERIVIILNYLRRDYNVQG